MMANQCDMKCYKLAEYAHIENRIVRSEKDAFARIMEILKMILFDKSSVLYGHKRF